ncbi:MAG: PAS domain-containing protein [Alphaproteobacteria bacterium]|nr:PAS domain-containing protein [Alphaproteobacteria bacterium]
MDTDIISLARTYWDRIRGSRQMPSRKDIDPGDIRDILPNVVLLDVQQEPLDFRYRLIGTEVDRHSSEKHTGKWVTDIPERAPPSKVWENLVHVVETGAPSEQSVPYVGPLQDFVTTRQITLPLSDNGSDVNMLLIVIDYVVRS